MSHKWVTGLALSTALGMGVAQAEQNAFVHLFEWSWSDVAEECEAFLGPHGFTGVQVSPPNEHITVENWWARYQPVSYQLESRSGSRAEFIDMVQRCNAVGVDIYADLVINHTAAGSGGVGSGGTVWSYKDHPMYSPWDYHNYGCEIDYQDAWSVRNCPLVGLPDLATGNDYVQQTIANFINDLVGIGVAGFRIDAAKHMHPNDIAGILNRVDGQPYFYSEVIDVGGEAVTSDEYLFLGDVEEFKYSRDIGSTFDWGQLSWLEFFGEAWGFLPGEQAVVFVDNHDNQRGHGAGGDILTYKRGDFYALANVFMLAWPHGHPRLMSSYDFIDTEAGPPAASVHGGNGLNCFGGDWICEHRWQPIAGMVGFRSAVAGQPVQNWWSDGGNRIAFSRGERGFVAINRTGQSLSTTLQTGLPSGEYCNVVDSSPLQDCPGQRVQVQADGQATISLAPMSAIGLHVEAMTAGVGGPGDPDLTAVAFTCGNGHTQWGQSVYAVGSHPLLGSWDPANAVKLDPANYPTWNGQINLPQGEAVEWKCLKRSESDPGQMIEWQAGGNNSVLVEPAASTVGQF